MESIQAQPLKDLLNQFKSRFISLLFDVEASGIKPVQTNLAFGDNPMDTGAFGSIASMDEFTLHLLLLTSAAPYVAEQMLLHNAWLRWQLNKQVMSMVVYAGNGKHGLPKAIKGHGLNYKMWIHDARDMSPDFFLLSDDPTDLKFALLTGRETNKRPLIREILETMQSAFEGDQERLEENIRQIETLSALRGDKVTQQVVLELSAYL